MSGYFAPEAVGGEVGFAAERDGGFGRVDPEVGVLCVGCCAGVSGSWSLGGDGGGDGDGWVGGREGEGG